MIFWVEGWLEVNGRTHVGLERVKGLLLPAPAFRILIVVSYCFKSFELRWIFQILATNGELW